MSDGSRDDLQQYLHSCGVQSGIHYPKPIHMAPAFSYLRTERFPIAEESSERILSLPMYPELEANQIKHVTDQINSYMNGPGRSQRGSR